jgi:hypothetical protein
VDKQWSDQVKPALANLLLWQPVRWNGYGSLARSASNPVGLWTFCFFAAVPTLAMIERFVQVALTAHPFAPVAWTALLLQTLYLLGLFVSCKRLFSITLTPVRRIGGWHVLGVFTLLFMVFMVVYPIADSGRLGFYSDRDEAIDVAVRQLAAGNYPYRCKALSGIHDGCPAVGNPIAPLPGALLVSAPFVLVWGSAVQSFFWLGVFYFSSKRYTGNANLSSVHLLSLVVLAPVLVAEILTGGDLIANTLAVTSFILLSLRARSPMSGIVRGLLLGVMLSWRAHFILVAIPLAAYHIKSRELDKLLMIGLAAAVSFVAVTVPFWLVNPDAFTPWTVQQHFDEFKQILPHGNLVAIVIAVPLGAVLGFRSRTHEDLLIACAATLIVPMLLAILLNSMSQGRPTFLFFGWYAISSLFLGTLGAIMQHIKANAAEVDAANPGAALV